MLYICNIYKVIYNVCYILIMDYVLKCILNCEKYFFDREFLVLLE